MPRGKRRWHLPKRKFTAVEFKGSHRQTHSIKDPFEQSKRAKYSIIEKAKGVFCKRFPKY